MSPTSNPPNSGSSVPDAIAAGDNHEELTAWYQRNGIDAEKHIKITRLVHIRYQHPDLAEITQFLFDFGLHIAGRTDDEIWFRGYGRDPYVYYAKKGPKKFLGGTFEVESEADLLRASELPGATAIEALVDAPGGGRFITLTDPEGFPVNLIHGQILNDPGDYPEKIETNYEVEKPRARSFRRYKTGPAAVHKLGHFGVCVQNFDSVVTWYTKNFNMAPSDFIYVEKDGTRELVGMFAHIERGEDLVDHHTFFITKSGTSHVHHCSFEVHDFDTQQLGHQWLAQKGYTSVWGIGRHVLGSQIFDYWWDTTGFMVEHYADGDLVNNKTPVAYSPAGDESLAVWGPELPRGFLD
ncbi:Metapyrocatechase 2-like protein [Cladobotryum mycophilum]|uniref:Metapyrocatechase 2-like protein n=1 Tax=Cladobotryum mycophilum TaxID=491253 RepID=A0ABR0SUX7_9HYPO